MIALFVLSLGVLGVSYVQTGEFFERDISLAGGVTLSLDTRVDASQLESRLIEPGESLRIRSLGDQTVVELKTQDQQRIDELVDVLSEYGDVSVNFIGETLGASFFREALYALVFAFALMGFVVFLVFRRWLAAGYVIFAALADIIMTIATVNLLGLQISTGGLAAFLMLLGYSVDTDILLTTKMLKKQKAPIEERFNESFRTTLAMSGTSFIAVVIGAIVTNSPLIREIMIVIAIGLFWDVLNTWFVNGALVVRSLEASA